MKLTKNFSLKEFEASDMATQLGINNALPPHLLGNAQTTAEMMQRIRDALSAHARTDIPISLSSAYRCKALNKAVGSTDKSDHVLALAADWRAPAFGSPIEVARFLAPLVSKLDIGQLVYECPRPNRRWIHTSARRPDKAINRIITIGPNDDVRVGIVDI